MESESMPTAVLQSLNEDELSKVLSSPPFVQVEGIINIRDFGGHSTSAGVAVKPSYLFRSGEPSHITQKGMEQFQALGIRKVFDLRADAEIAKYRTPDVKIEGVEFVKLPILADAFDPVAIAQMLKNFATDESEAFLQLYTTILNHSGPAIETILRHIRDHPDQPCLIHCTAGKDRTGVFAALILKLLGVSDEIIAEDYALTTIGLQPALPMLTARFEKEQVFRDNKQGTINMATAKPQAIINLLALIERQYGGIEGYLKAHTTLGDRDLDVIRNNLLITPVPQTSTESLL